MPGVRKPLGKARELVAVRPGEEKDAKPEKQRRRASKQHEGPHGRRASKQHEGPHGRRASKDRRPSKAEGRPATHEVRKNGTRCEGAREPPELRAPPPPPAPTRPRKSAPAATAPTAPTPP